MAGHVFISYSRRDEQYVTELEAHLATAGIDAFVDRETDFGQAWTRVIQQAVDESGAVVVVMTSAADDSEWVQREIQRARAKLKPILPLLRDGEPFFVLGTEQYDDVRKGQMPSKKFLTSLQRYAGGEKSSGSPEGIVAEGDGSGMDTTPSDKGSVSRFILNCEYSTDVDQDWGYGDAIAAGAVRWPPIPVSKDLRRQWWEIRDQESSGAGVGFATASGLLEWHFAEAGWLMKADRLAPRFIWIANKEMSPFTSYPTTFIESAGTQIKQALGVARRYGCVLEEDLPMDGGSSRLSTAAFYSKAARFRIASYYNLGPSLNVWRRWIANQGPVLTRVGVDETWDRAAETDGVLHEYQHDTVRGGHAVSLVGYTEDHLIVRNSWGTEWGDQGHAYAANSYAQQAFTEAYGAVT